MVDILNVQTQEFILGFIVQIIQASFDELIDVGCTFDVHTCILTKKEDKRFSLSSVQRFMSSVYSFA